MNAPPGLTPLFSAAEIAAAVRGLAARIALTAGSEPVFLVGVLKGALFLTSDLARALPPTVDARIDFLRVSSYGEAQASSGRVRLVEDVGEDVAGKHVVLVDGIVDTGLTLHHLRDRLSRRGPASLRTCVLLDKPYRRAVEVPLDFSGLVAPDAFVVGYGLDYQEKYRNLPYLARLQPELPKDRGVVFRRP